MTKTEFKTQNELFAHLKANKAALVAQKKSTTKYADAVAYVDKSPFVHPDIEVDKAEATENTPADGVITVLSVINTTNILDSHDDVHIPGIWSKTLKETKQHWLVKEHHFDFDHIISDAVQASTRNMEWTALGFPEFKGQTQALIFKSEISPDDKTGMYERYKAGKVPNHSVGMRYVKIELAINSSAEDFAEEKAVWDKYIDQIANAEDAKANGYFWAITEAKIVEGSAVLRGSNYATPVISVKSEPSNDTQPVEPPAEALKTDSIFTRTAKYINQ